MIAVQAVDARSLLALPDEAVDVVGDLSVSVVDRFAEFYAEFPPLTKAERRRLKAGIPPQHDHPAPFSLELYAPLCAAIAGCDSVLDPFSGNGRIHQIADLAGVRLSVGVELEREWSNVEMFAKAPRLQIVGDSTKVLPRMRRVFDAVCTSPVYASRMSDHHEAKDPCKKCVGTGTVVALSGVGPCRSCKGTGRSRRNTYRHRLGRPLSENSAGGMQWGEPYRDLHRKVWAAAASRIRPGGLFIVNVSNHIRKGVEIDVVGWHQQALDEIGLTFERRIDVPTRRNKQGANGAARVKTEAVLIYRKAA